jgi:DNA recombination protein RmuC
MIIITIILSCYSILASYLLFVSRRNLRKILSEKEREKVRFDNINIELTRLISEAGTLKNQTQAQEKLINSNNQQILELSKNNSALLKSEELLKEINKKLENQITSLESDKTGLNNQISSLCAKEAQIKTEKEALEKSIEEQKTFIEKAQENLKTEFKNISNQYLKDNSTEFLTSSSAKLQDILNPFSKEVAGLKKKVEETYKTEAEERISLETHIKTHINLLVEQSNKMQSTTENLTKALKGDRKIQGNWGEFILEQLLENSGLKKDFHYTTQESFLDEEGKRQLPDVIIKLSEGKDIIVDSKVSLVAYERYFNDTSQNASIYAREFIESVKSHINKLEAKSYQNNAEINSLDFVIMFMPIEGTYQLAYELDKEIFSYGWKKKVILTSPSTLFPLLKAIASMWKIDAQNKNVQEIIRLATSLYDKFISFGNNLEMIGKNIENSQKSYTLAIKQLSDGDGNAVSLVKRLENYGIEKKSAKNKKMPVFMQELGDQKIEKELEMSED